MDAQQLIIIGSNDLRVAEIAMACNKSIEEVGVVLIDAANTMRLPFDQLSLAMHQAMVPVVELKTVIEDFEKLVRCCPSRYEVVAFGNREPRGYDKFLPKPIGKQRRSRR